jgi:hypothetical protein
MTRIGAVKLDGLKWQELVRGQAAAEDQDICDRCGCARVDEDDDGLHWKTVRGRRVCRTCVFELVLATAQTEGWWSSTRKAI